MSWIYSPFFAGGGVLSTDELPERERKGESERERDRESEREREGVLSETLLW